MGMTKEQKVFAIIGGAAAAAAAGVAGYFGWKKKKSAAAEVQPPKEEERLGWAPPEDKKPEPVSKPVEDEPASAYLAEREAPPESDVYDGEVTQDMRRQIREANRLKPHLISKKDFDYGEEYYDKNTLCWYCGDGTLTDEDSELIVSPERLLGSDVIDLLERTDEEIIYVRNDTFGADYAIVRYPESYASEVLGEDDTM